MTRKHHPKKIKPNIKYLRKYFKVTNINTGLSDEKFIKLYSERIITFTGYAVCNSHYISDPQTTLTTVTLSFLITQAQKTLCIMRRCGFLMIQATSVPSERENRKELVESHRNASTTDDSSEPMVAARIQNS